MVVSFILLIIFVLLYLVLDCTDEALFIMDALPSALIGGFWLLYLLGYNPSVTGVVDFIALAGMVVKFDVIMLLYLEHAWTERQENGQAPTQVLLGMTQGGAVLRVRPKAMTVAVVLTGLLPIMWSDGAGSGIMQCIVAPMVGSMIAAPLPFLFVIPVVYLLLRRRDGGQPIP